MILTITANSALDRVIFIDTFQPETGMRAHRVVESVGGKGLDASVVLQALGVPNLAIAALAGPAGRRLEELLQAYGIPLDLLWVEGDTRVAHVLVEERDHRHSHIVTPGYRLGAAGQSELLRRFQQHLSSASWAIAAGSLPEGLDAGFYADLTVLATGRNVNILVDCSGDPLCRCLPARPAVIKMNRAEFCATFGLQADGEASLVRAVREVRAAHGLPALVITLGEAGILADTGEGTFLAAGPRVLPVNAAGGGDAVSAALAWRLSEGDSWPDALRWASAAGTAVVLTPGTADCSPEDVRRILHQTTVRRETQGDAT